VIHLESNICFNLVAVYAFNTQEQRKGLWNFINDICNKTSGNLLIGGNFNSVLLVEDRLNGNPVTPHEIQVRNALFSMDPSKALGIDGFNVHFFKSTWNVIGGSITAAVIDYFRTGFMPRIINNTYVTLIPKIPNATSIKNYRPIACCSVIYKIISKVLTNIMQDVQDSIVSESQYAFIKGRVIFDNIILSHELVKSYGRKGVSPRCMLKIDLQKAYDSLEWPFVNYLMLKLGFPYKFVNWVMACITTASYTFNVNGDLTSPFQAKKGLRQGDPISPYLFVICMEYLNRCLMQLKENSEFRYHPRCKRLHLMHICFVDDLLLFSRGDVGSVTQLFEAFNLFSAASGLKANQSKSSIYFGGVALNVQEAILTKFGLTKGELTFKYLRVPLSSKKLTVMQCQPLVKKIISRIENWSSKLLSYAGRLQLIKSVLFGVQTYWSQVFALPQKVLKLIQTACRVFLWTGKSGTSKRALIAWEHIYLPKSVGGWNVIDMHCWNQAALSKQFWNLANKKDLLWVKWVHEYYIKGRNVLLMEIPSQASWVVKKVFDGAKTFSNVNGDVFQQANFSIKRMYNALRGDFVKVSGRKMTCNNSAPPKCLFVTWLAIHGRLLTCDRLSKVGIHCDQTCILCKKENETYSHLFFTCEYSKAVWTGAMQWSNLTINASN